MASRAMGPTPSQIARALPTLWGDLADFAVYAEDGKPAEGDQPVRKYGHHGCTGSGGWRLVTGANRSRSPWRAKSPVVQTSGRCIGRSHDQGPDFEICHRSAIIRINAA